MNQINENNLNFTIADFHRAAEEHRKARDGGFIRKSGVRSVTARLLRRAADRIEPGKIQDNHIPAA